MSPITIKQGADFAWYNWLAYKSDGKPVDLTGVQAFSQLRVLPKKELVADGVCEIEAESGTIITNYPSSVTERIEAGEYGFDVWIISEGHRIDIDTVELTIVDPYTEIGED